jgi:tRNA (cmo5U34)-methyltransferase
MLDQARSRFGPDPRVRFSLQDHLALCASEDFDLVVSALSIHHLPDPAKPILFRKIFDALRPGGLFVNADQALAPTAEGERQYQEMWLRDVKASGISDPVLDQALERVRADRSALLADQLMWLAEAGFTGIDCWYKRFRFVVYGGYKSKD